MWEINWQNNSKLLSHSCHLTLPCNLKTHFPHDSDKVHMGRSPFKLQSKQKLGKGYKIWDETVMYLFQANTVEQPRLKKKKCKFTFQFNSVQCWGCVRYIQTHTGCVGWGQGPISPGACRAEQSNLGSLTLNVISSHQPQRDSPIEIPLQLPSWQSRSPPPCLCCQ